MIKFSKFPMPLTVNHAYVSFIRNGKQVRAKSKESKEFDAAANEWKLRNNLSVIEARMLLHDHDHPLIIDTAFYFNKKRVYCKDGKIKKMDTSNRIKPLHDALSDILLVDDCRFFRGSFSKNVIGDEEQEYVEIKISYYIDDLRYNNKSKLIYF